jgi:hypothetical protein
MHQSHAWWVAALLVAVLLPACGGTDVMDAHCSPDNPDINADEDCPFERGLGPQVNEAICPTVEGEATEEVTWNDVYDIFRAKQKGNCGSPACHGVQETAALGIFLPENDPFEFYKTLIETQGSVKRPYVNKASPRESWIVCNVAGIPGGGFPMPRPAGLTEQVDIDKVVNWVRLGAAGPE